MATFGNYAADLTGYASTDTMGAAVAIEQEFTTPADCEGIDSLVFGGASTSGAQNVKAVIWNNTTGARVGVSAGVALNTTVEWKTFTFSQALSPNTTYKFGVVAEAQTDTTIFCFNGSGTHDPQYMTGCTYADPPTWSSSGSAADNTTELAIYLTYTPSGGGGLVIPVVMHHYRIGKV